MRNYHKATEFLHEQRGNFAVIFAVAALPILALSGLALDYSRMMRAEQTLQSGVDAAVVAAIGTGGNTATIQQTVKAFLAANTRLSDLHVQTIVDRHTVRVNAAHSLDLPVLSAVGIPQTEIVATAKLTSLTPIRRSGVPSEVKRDTMRAFERRIARLPSATRKRMREWMRAWLAALPDEPPRYYLSE